MAAAPIEEVPFDVLEEILIRLDVKDLILCKSVSKSWQSFISTPDFIKAHLKHSYNNDRHNPEFVNRRISLVITTKHKCEEVVGSCNGLVCFSSSSSTNAHDEFVVTNPCTREVNKTTPFRPLLDTHKTETPVCQGFGYDSSTDDYKVIAGFTSEEKQRILFYVLTLKSNVWKLIGEVKYSTCVDFGDTGIFYGGALHWLMYDANKRVKLISLDLSTEEFKEIPQPTLEDYAPVHMNHQCDEERGCYQYTLGVLEECLSISRHTLRFNFPTSRLNMIWVMRNNKWEPHGNYYFHRRTNDAEHRIHESQKTGYTLGYAGQSLGLSLKSYSIFVHSLVSPHPCVNNNDNYYEGRTWNTKGITKKGKKNKRKRNKRRKRSCERKKAI